MIMNLILSCILVALLLIWFELHEFKRANEPTPNRHVKVGNSAEVELLAGVTGDWHYHSTRPEGHRDIAEALNTPGMAVRRNGVIEEGNQDD